jgi:hypothetical protein
MNELMQQKLGGEDSDQRHVVFLADGPSTHELLGQSSDGRGLEDSVVFDLLFAKHVVDIFGGGCKETLAVGSPVGLFVTIGNGVWDQSSDGAL